MSAGVMWRVRLDDGSEYGPVAEGKLLSWAREGRITPSSQISSDGGTIWILAPRKPELGMDWLVETSPGEYFGPFHHDVVQGLLDSKKITSETRIFRLSDKSEPALKLEIGKLQADYERVKSEKEDAAKRVQSLSAERDKSRAEAAEAIKREVALAEKTKECGTALEQLRSVFEGTQAKLKQTEAHGVELATKLKASEERGEAVAAELAESKSALEDVRSELAALKDELAAAKTRRTELSVALEVSGKREAEREALLKASEEKCTVLAAEVESEQDRGRKLGESLSASACREASLAEETRSLKNAMDQASARIRELSEELESARAEVVKERKTCGELRVALEKAEKSGKRTGLGNLFQGKSLRDLSLLELAAQREFARRKRGRDPLGHDRSNADVIDV